MIGNPSSVLNPKYLRRGNRPLIDNVRAVKIRNARGKIMTITAEPELEKQWPHIMARYPLIGELWTSKQAFMRNCRRIGEEPSLGTLMRVFGHWANEGVSYNFRELRDAMHVSDDAAHAYLYLLSKMGLIAHSKDLKAFIMVRDTKEKCHGEG